MVDDEVNQLRLPPLNDDHSPDDTLELKHFHFAIQTVEDSKTQQRFLRQLRSLAKICLYSCLNPFRKVFFTEEETAVHLILKQATSNNIFDWHLVFENCGIPTWLDWTRGTGEQTLTSSHVGHVHLWINREFPSVHITPSGIGRSDRT